MQESVVLKLWVSTHPRVCPGHPRRAPQAAGAPAPVCGGLTGQRAQAGSAEADASLTGAPRSRSGLCGVRDGRSLVSLVTGT